MRHARIESLYRAASDAACWVLSLLLASLLRFEFEITAPSWWPTLMLAVFTAIAFICLGYALGLYRGKYDYGSFQETRTVMVTAVLITVGTSVLLLTANIQTGIPRSLIVIGAPIAALLMLGTRYVYRIVVERARHPQHEATPALVVGAGPAGEIAIRTVMHDPKSPIRVVGLIDDDPTKRKLILHGIAVLGDSTQISDLAKVTGAKVLIIAVAEPSPELLHKLTDCGERLGLRVLRLPTIQRLMEGPIEVNDLRKVSIEDLMGRKSIDTDIDTIAGFLTGKRVLVTGAGGSIGAELSRQISEFSPAELIMLDHDETGLQSAQLDISGHGLLDSDEIVLGCVRDKQALFELFASRRPQVVFHAAALKHLPVLEQFPAEAWKTNVMGTSNVVAAAMAHDVETFINISTDKAANPTSVLGHSKRTAEKITAWAAHETGRPYLSVRFGNVIGSRGSMLPTFMALVEKGGPLTVTHPDVTRYFMTIPEACQLVVQAGGIGRPGEVMILDMGEPVRILDIAKRIIAASGKDVEIIYTGLREGEKLHEELVDHNELLERPFHEKIAHVTVEPLAPELIDVDIWMSAIMEAKGATNV